MRNTWLPKSVTMVRLARPEPFHEPECMPVGVPWWRRWARQVLLDCVEAGQGFRMAAPQPARHVWLRAVRHSNAQYVFTGEDPRGPRWEPFVSADPRFSREQLPGRRPGRVVRLPQPTVILSGSGETNLCATGRWGRPWCGTVSS
ncbi:hypothetical protein ACVWXU_000206 [Streptomyces sp. TE33382]